MGRVADEAAGGWPDDVWGPSEVPFNEQFPKPKALTDKSVDADEAEEDQLLAADEDDADLELGGEAEAEVKKVKKRRSRAAPKSKEDIEKRLEGRLQLWSTCCRRCPRRASSTSKRLKTRCTSSRERSR
ncbi:hypothetical protein NUW54_g8273 [Trametes sanguinea]|uniref:Uncharacterized protein n=1 Tax=Trametes sanguinea TaxID=158606 RepID=A0ACC1PEM1_9APHY|nr:hypothetical protein NUW54_g8273 [Trametes sanguinea]